MQQKPQLHQSHLNMLYRCGEQFYRVYILGHREPPGVAMLVGSATHKTIQVDLTHKAENKSLLSDTEIKDTARDSFVKIWGESSVHLDKKQRALGLKKVKGGGIEESIRLSLLHHKHLAPRLRPKAGGIERAWVIKCTGYPYDLAGQIDIQEEFTIKDPGSGKEEVKMAIRDTKTRTGSPPRDWADTSEALTLYSMAVYVLDKRMPDSVWLDCLVKEKSPRVVSLSSKRTQVDFIVAKNRFERACEIIDRSVFTPASRNDWWCSEKYCGFAADGSCRFFTRGERPKLVPIKKGGDRGRAEKRKLIPAGSADWWDAVR